MTQIWKAVFTLPHTQLIEIEENLWELFDNVSVYGREENSEQQDIQITYQGNQDKDKIVERITELCQKNQISVPNIAFEEIPDINWLEHVYRAYPPVEAGRFFIHGEHITDCPEDGVSILVNAATAFGTGEHATTKGCLLALDDILDQGKFDHILDMGCGSGVLSIALAKVLNKKVVAIDVDEEAIRVTNHNAAINAVADYIVAECGDGFAAEGVRQNHHYDLIVANILAEPLIKMASDITRYSAPNGLVILSGLLKTQESLICSAYLPLGFDVIATYPIDEWQTLVLRKQ